MSMSIKEEPAQQADQEVRAVFSIPEPIFTSEDLLHHNLTPCSSSTLHSGNIYGSACDDSHKYSQGNAYYNEVCQATDSPYTPVDQEAFTSLPSLNQPFSPLDRAMNQPPAWYPRSYVLRTVLNNPSQDESTNSCVKEEAVTKKETPESLEQRTFVQELNWSPRQKQQAAYDKKLPDIPTASGSESSSSE